MRETGEALPETAKLAALGTALGVSLDWLLSDAEPEEPEEEPARPEDWTDKLPRMVRGAAKRWGWLAGIYVIRYGAIVFFGGALVNLITLPSLKRSQQLVDEYPFLSDVYGMTGTEGNLLTIVATIVTVFGLAVVIAGIALTVYLRKRRWE